MERMGFEEGMARLEEIVKSLEEGSLPLQDCFDAYERGVRLIRELGAQLDAGEARIRALTGDGVVPFEAEDGA